MAVLRCVETLNIKAMQFSDLISNLRGSNPESIGKTHNKTTVAVSKHSSSNKVLTLFPNIIHLLDSVEPDIRFVVQIEADVGRSEAE